MLDVLESKVIVMRAVTVLLNYSGVPTSELTTKCFMFVSRLVDVAV